MEKQEETLRNEGKKKFEVKLRAGEAGRVEKAIFIDDELLDWQVDVNALFEAKKMGPAIFHAVQKDVEKHFVESVGEFLGRRVSMEDINSAIKTGWI